MSLSELFAKMKRYDQNATIIFDRDEPVGQPTDLVMPYRPWFGRGVRRKSSRSDESAAKTS